MALRRWLAPSYADWLFAALLVWLFASGSGWSALLADGDAGWHIRTGEFILDTHTVPRQDLFSFSKSGEPWYAWEWLADVIFAGAHRALGLGGVVLLAGAVIAAYLVVLFRHALWRGADFFAAALTCLVATGASTIHFLARPHIFSLLLLAVSLWLIDRDRALVGRPFQAAAGFPAGAPGGSPAAARKRRPTIWLLVPLAAVWANLHGGFVALPASLAVLAAGGLLQRRFKEAGRYAALAAACAAASLANPYGVQLHRHLFQYLRSDWIRQAVDEFQSPKFRSESALDFELLLGAAVLVAGGLVRRRRFGEALLLAGWAHAALVSVRHVPVFAVVACPPVAEAASRLWRGWAKAKPARSAPRILEKMAGELAGAARRQSVWPALLVLALAVAPVSWPRDFPALKFPSALLDRHPELAGARVFTSDQWGDYLIYRQYPRTRVFIDGRSDFYGERHGKLYLALIYGGADWRAVLDKNEFAYVLAERDWPLASLLRASAGWRLADEAGPALLFEPTENTSIRRNRWRRAGQQ